MTDGMGSDRHIAWQLSSGPNVRFGSKADIEACPIKQTLRSRHRDVRFVPKADIQVAFGYYCWWARVLKFMEHHP